MIQASTIDTPLGLKLNGTITNELHELLSAEALDFLLALHERFNERRKQLLLRRTGSPELPGELEITPFNQEKATINSQLLSGIRVVAPGELGKVSAKNGNYLLDLNDYLVPTEAIQTLDQVAALVSSQEGLNLLIAPRNFDLEDRLFIIHDRPASASLVDFGLFFFHNAHELLRHGIAPTIYLPDVHSQSEARLWNEVFTFSQGYLGMPHGTLKVVCEVGTLSATLETPQIVQELKTHLTGLACNPEGYLVDYLTHFGDKTLPDLDQLSLSGKMLGSFCDLMVQNAHRNHLLAFFSNDKITKSETQRYLDKAFDAKIGTDIEPQAPIAHSQLLNQRRDTVVSLDNLLACPVGTITVEGVKKCVSEAQSGSILAQCMISGWIENKATTASGLLITEAFVRSIQ